MTSELKDIVLEQGQEIVVVSGNYRTEFNVGGIILQKNDTVLFRNDRPTLLDVSVDPDESLKCKPFFCLPIYAPELMSWEDATQYAADFEGFGFSKGSCHPSQTKLIKSNF